MNSGTKNVRITETLAENRFSLIRCGLRLDNGEPVVLKTLKADVITVDELARFRHEFKITSGLDLPGVVKAIALEEGEKGYTIVFKDIGGQSLDRMLEQATLSLTDTLELAIALADTVGQLHKRQIIHKDINPSNIVFNPVSKRINLIDFGLADELPERSITPLPPSALEGTLAYISPEQTGRMNRPVDYRTDLYSLGITLYRMLTGKLPFEAADAPGMVHAHIAQVPIPPHKRNSAIPERVSLIVMKLISKMAEERYQSAFGLKADLEKCLQGLRNEGVIGDFELALEDFSDQLRFPDKLYGREGELAQLLKSFERVSRGKCELLLLTGYPGVGKTRLAREIYKTVIEKQGYFIEGKFDQLQRNVPYFAWNQAFTGLVDHFLMESTAQLKEWRQEIQKAVGNIGRVLTDVISNLELIIGPQPKVSEPGGVEAQNRFNHVFQEFVKAITAQDRPLVVFLDDLQWIDAASLKLLETLMTGGASNLLLIGAYRDNEVDALHPLLTCVDALRKRNTHIEQLTLRELGENTVNDLIGDTLNQDRFETVPLSHLVFAKTGGNPFFLLQTLKVIADQKALSFDPSSRNWKWDLPSIEKMKISDNIVTLMAEKIHPLESGTQHLFSLAACLGFEFTLHDLCVIAGEAEEPVLESLQPAIREGLITAGTARFQFAHDRIHQTAYSLIPDNERSARHLQIGRLLLEHTPKEKLADKVFAIVDHLDRGMSLMTEPAERKRLAELNLVAGKRARVSAAFSHAVNYFVNGVEALGSGAWEENYDLAFSLNTKLAECEYIVGNFAHSEELAAIALEHARTSLDRVLVYRLYQRLYQHSGRWPEAVEAALKGLELLDITFPQGDKNIEAAIEAENRRIEFNLRGRSISELADIAFTDDVEARTLIGLLAEAMPQCYITRPALWPLIVGRAVNRCLEHGNVEESPYIFSTYAMLLTGRYDDISSAFQFSQMALKLNERLPGSSVMNGLPQFFHASVISIWHRHFRISLPLMEQAFHALLDSGEIVWASYLTYHGIWLRFELGDPLEQVIELARQYEAFNRQNHNDVVYNVNRIEEQFVLSLRDKTRSLTSFNDDHFNETDTVAVMKQAGFDVGLAYFYIMKHIAAFHAGRFEEASKWADRADSVLPSVSSMAIWGTYYFFRALTLTTLYDARKPKIVAKLRDARERLKSWAESCPENFSNRSLLVEAEIARIAGRDTEALRLYDQAIASARKNGFIQYEAIACEIAAMFCRQREIEKFYRAYLHDAVACYGRWGADGKVNQLKRLHPWLESSIQVEEKKLTEHLDLASLTRAQRAISSKMEMSGLLASVMQIVIENAGAQTGCLLLERGGGWVVAARGEAGKVEVTLPDAIDIDESDLVARNVVHFVARTQKNVVLDDAADKGEFINDPYIKQRKTRSLLCIPLLSLGKLIGILYLENNLTTQAFLPDRIQLLEMILSQAAISLENARIYEALLENEKRYRLVFENSLIAISEEDFSTVKRVFDELRKEGVIDIESYFEQHPDTLRQCAKSIRIIDVNYAALSLHGATSKAELVENLARSATAESFDAFKKELIELWNGSTEITMDTVIKTISDDLKYVTVSLSVCPGEEASLSRIIVSIVDVSDRALAEKTLKDYRDHLEEMIGERTAELQRTQLFNKAVLENVSDGIVACDENGVLSLFNRATREMHGIDQEHLPSDVWAKHYNLYLADCVTPMRQEDVPLFRTFQGEIIRNDEMAIRNVDGKMVVVLASGQPMVDENGNKIGAVVSMHDITELKRGEAELIRARENAEAANKAKSAFLANMSHELRTPLNAILGFTEMLGRDKNATSAQKEKLAIINRNGEHLLAMINDVLDLSKIEAGRMEPEFEAFDLQSLLQVIGHTFAIRADNAGLKFELESAPELVRYIKTDTGKLRQILTNLLDNAVKFTREGGFSLRVRSFPMDDNPAMITLQIEVEDSGPGIAPEELEHVFEPFVQAENSLPGSKGTGLGLTITRAFIELMGGEIRVESTPGKGSIFRVELPVVLAQAAESDTAEIVKPMMLGLEPGQPTWKILVVEGNVANRLLLGSLLEQAGFELRDAENGEQAVAIFKEWHPDLVWMDMSMPVMDGYKATATIRTLPGGDKVKIIAITASAFKEQRKHIMESGCNDVVHKPFKRHEIFDMMAAQLGVRYTYEEVVVKSKPTSAEVYAGAVAALPQEVLINLRTAAKYLSSEDFQNALVSVRERDPELAEGLSALAREFRFDRILSLIGDEGKKSDT